MEKKRKDEPNRMTIYQTVCYVMKGKKILMIKRAAGLFGEGKWSGLGGKIEAGESKEQACIREVYEESGLNVDNLNYHGTLKFSFEGTVEPIVVYAFSTTSFKGQPRESPEGILRWIDSEEIPYEEMWDDARYWLPLLIGGKNFTGEFHFDHDVTKVLNHKLEAS